VRINISKAIVNVETKGNAKSKASAAGFTLIEVIVGIVVLSISFSILTTLIYPLANQSAEQVHQIRAAELGQSMINEILGRAFDENSAIAGGYFRCGEDQDNDSDVEGDELCSQSLGSEIGETRITYDDVDDYDAINFGSTIENSVGENISAKYLGFSMNVTVINDANYDGSGTGNNSTAKLITVTVRTPQSFDFVFAFYKVNF
jgi:MSHA pilin protein MshD